MLADAILHALPELRREAEALMTDTCTVGHPGGEPVYNREARAYETPTTQVYAGPCRVRRMAQTSIEVDAADQFTMTNRVVISLPVGASGIASSDLLTITASPNNPQLVGAKFRVRSILDHSQPIAVRLECEEA